jgi:hypothetical protein
LITPITAICLSLLGLLIGLVAARYGLTRALSRSGAHLSELDAFFEQLPASTAGSIAGGISTPATVSPAAIATPTVLPVSQSTDLIENASTSSSVSSNSSSPAVSISAQNAATAKADTSANATSNSISQPVTISNVATPAVLSKGTSTAFPFSSSLSETSKLRPAEIAYLVRGGDLTHTLIVVVVDLIQRSLKSQDSSFTDGLADYEKNMWKFVSRSVKDWAKDKILAGAQNPVAITRRMFFLFHFIRTSLRGLLAETVADPKRLKKYFSPGGVLRIIADFTSSGYRQAFQDELRRSLLRRGLLVPEKTREQIGRYFFVIGVVGIISTLVVSFLFLPTSGVAFVAWISTLIAGFLGRSLLALRHLIPFYEELAVVAEQIRRKSFRLGIVKMVLRSVNAVSWLALVLGVSISIATGFGIIKLIYPAADISIFYAIIALATAHFAIADFIFNGVKLNIQECPTAIAEKQLEEMRQELEHVSPLDTFTTLLSSPDYDPKFSKILALYGVETLLILI